MNRSNQFISLITAVLVLFLAGAAFWLSFDALRHLAIDNGIALALAWLYPAIVDGAIIVFSLSVLRANLNKERAWYPWLLVGLFTVLSVVLNIFHARETVMARVLAAVPPLALFLSFELLMGQVKATVQRAATLRSLQEVQTAVRQKRQELDDWTRSRTAELEKLAAQIEQATARKNALASELKELNRESRMAKSSDTDSIGRARAARMAAKSEAVRLLLAYLDAHPDATLSDMAEAIGRSKSTAGAYVSELQTDGRLHRNGHGWEVRAP
jgi:hypothetical protein